MGRLASGRARGARYEQLPDPHDVRAGHRPRACLQRDRQPVEGRGGPGRAGPQPDAGAAGDRGAGNGRRLQGTSGAVSFFSSRWVDAPEHVRELDPAELPAGFRAAGAGAGIKPDGLDVGVLFCEAADAVSAARFTTNARVGAPVIVSRESALDRLRAVVANSGSSNVGDGERGLETARAMQREAAEAFRIDPEQVGVASTGVIGWELPREKVLAGIRECVAQMGGVTPLQARDARAAGAAAFAQAILTSDRGPKGASL